MNHHPLKCRFINPRPSAAHTHTVIFLHGRGSTAARFESDIGITTDSQGRALPELFPSIRWVLPESERRPLERFQGGEMIQWFDTWNIQNLSDREELQLPGLRESVESVRAIVESETALVGGDRSRIILAGVSQGGAVAAHTLINLGGPRLGGLMTFCSRFPYPERRLEETRRILGLKGVPFDDRAVLETPVLWQHCVDDPLVKIEYGRQLRDTFLAFGAKVDWKEYPDGGHWIKTPEGVELAAAWLKEHVFDNNNTSTSE
ncbi:acyl-protein thioesterase [Podospora aff. communis PSN243]|uniref:Acyl-protein thioesterase n=1 Tax=Podospora aff. communis PSN243 TaxID=3040156 RepID=A0AAV9GF74_9PEZI|nr:acyl-protein thioesterase [Podospora aff. communis PSN243]